MLRQYKSPIMKIGLFAIEIEVIMEFNLEASAMLSGVLLGGRYIRMKQYFELSSIKSKITILVKII